MKFKVKIGTTYEKPVQGNRLQLAYSTHSFRNMKQVRSGFLDLSDFQGGPTHACQMTLKRLFMRGAKIKHLSSAVILAFENTGIESSLKFT